MAALEGCLSYLGTITPRPYTKLSIQQRAVLISTTLRCLHPGADAVHSPYLYMCILYMYTYICVMTVLFLITGERNVAVAILTTYPAIYRTRTCQRSKGISVIRQIKRSCISTLYLTDYAWLRKSAFGTIHRPPKYAYLKPIQDVRITVLIITQKLLRQL